VFEASPASETHVCNCYNRALALDILSHLAITRPMTLTIAVVGQSTCTSAGRFATIRDLLITRAVRPMRKLLPLIFTFLTLAAAPGCCVLELHPLPWMVSTKPRSTPADDRLDRAPVVTVAQSATAAGSL
jgi:hypothetical protein